jgi:ribosome-associated protein
VNTPPTHQPSSGLEVAPRVFIPESVLDFSFSSSSGPGGQNVNKRATKCTLRLRIESLPISPGAKHRLAALGSHYLTDAGELIIQTDDLRSQERNKSECLAKLRALIIEAQRVPKVRKATKPSKAAKRRRVDEKRHRGEAKRRRRESDD